LRLLLSSVCTVASAAFAQDQLYKYTDKRRARRLQRQPAAGRREQHPAQAHGQPTCIDTSEASYPLQVAQQRNPMTLYAGDLRPRSASGARAVLNTAGRAVQGSRSIEAERSGEDARDARRFVDSRPVRRRCASCSRASRRHAWQSALDTAGYPKTPPARVTTIRNDAARQAAEKLAGKPPGKK
jgi:hypothetical protein